MILESVERERETVLFLTRNIQFVEEKYLRVNILTWD